MPTQKPNPEMIDAENPEWTDDDFKRARPGKEFLREALGEEAAQAILKPRGRPKAEKTKTQISLRLDESTIEAWRATGRGWQTRMAEQLAKSAPKG